MRTHHLAWSSPERAKDGRPLPPIANELLLEILEYIVPGPSFTSGEAKKMLGALSRTCRFFASVCVPRLFREIEYTPTSPAPIFTWARMIQKIQPEALAVCQHVESLSFHDWSSKDSQLFLNFGMVTLTRLPRLAHLSFYRMNVSRKAIDAIANMDDLNSLHLEYCSFGPDDVPFARSRVRELSVIHALWAGHVEEAVTRLADPHVLRVLRTNRFSLALRLIHTGATFTVLDVLEITARDVELDESEQQLLAGFFKNTPVLRVLAVTLPSRWRAAVSPDVLRQLSQLKAPLGLLLKVGSDHPISSLDLVLPYFSNSDISVTLDPDKLGSSFSWKTLLSRLVELEISSVLRVPGGILAHTDRLEVFTINCENTFQKKTHQIVELIMEHFKSSPPKLRSFSLRNLGCVQLHLPQQLEIVLQVAERAPSLVNVIVGPYICWTREIPGLSSLSRSWRPTVISKEDLRASVLAIGTERDVQLADHGGLLCRTFAEDIAAGKITLS